MLHTYKYYIDSHKQRPKRAVCSIESVISLKRPITLEKKKKEEEEEGEGWFVSNAFSDSFQQQ